MLALEMQRTPAARWQLTFVVPNGIQDFHGATFMRTPTLPGQPFWRAAEDPGECANCGSAIDPGARVLYFPSYRSMLCEREKCGGEATKELDAA